MRSRTTKTYNRWGQPVSDQYLGGRSRAVQLDKGFYDLTSGGLCGRSGEEYRITGRIGRHGLCQLRSTSDPRKSVDLGHQMGEGKEINFVLPGPVEVEWFGLHSPDFKLFAELING